MVSEDFYRLINDNWGKVLGGIVGLVIALLIVGFGFWRGLFILVCIAVGIYVGSRYEHSEQVRDFFRRLWEGRERF